MFNNVQKHYVHTLAIGNYFAGEMRLSFLHPCGPTVNFCYPPEPDVLVISTECTDGCVSNYSDWSSLHNI